MDNLKLYRCYVLYNLKICGNLLKKTNYSVVVTVMVFPLGSSNWSIVRISMIIVIPQMIIIAKIVTVKIPDQIGIVKKVIVSTASWNASFVPVSSKNGSTWNIRFYLNKPFNWTNKKITNYLNPFLHITVICTPIE